MSEKQPFWLPSGGKDESHQIDLDRQHTDTDSSETFLSQFLGDPVGYIDPIYADLSARFERTWRLKVDIAGTEYGPEDVVDFVVEDSIESDDGPAIGQSIISRLVLRLRTDSEIPPNARIVPYVALAEGENISDWIPLGVFFIDNRERQNRIWTFECYDGLVFADVAYVSQLNYPATMQEVWDEICDRIGLQSDSSVQINPSYTIPAGPAGFSCRQVLGFIAGTHGAVVKMTRNGKIGWKKFAANAQPVFEFTEREYIRVRQTNPIKTYTRLVVVYDDQDGLAYEAGTGDENHTFTMFNPLMTQGMVNALLQQIGGFLYVPIEMDARSFPHLEPGDIINVEIVRDRNAPEYTWETADITWEDADFPWEPRAWVQTVILRQTLSFKGGLAMRIEAPAKSEQKSEFPIQGTLTQQVNRLAKESVRFGKPFYGVTHSREQGIVIQREDGKAKAVFNADELSFYKGSQKAIYFDVQNDQYVFNGHLQAASGTFAGALQAATGTFTGQLQGGSILIGNGNNVFRADTQGIWAGHADFASAPFRVGMDGRLVATDANISGTITATSGTIGGWGVFSGYLFGGTLLGGVVRADRVETAEPGNYPRIAISATGNELIFQTASNQYVRIYPIAGFFQIEMVNGTSLFNISKGTSGTTIQTNDLLQLTNGSCTILTTGNMIFLSAPGGIYANGNPIG